MRNRIEKYLLDDKGDFSSQRLAFFIAVLVATIMSLAAIHLAYTDSLTWDYVFLTLSIWAIATLQKNWAKQIEKIKK